MQTLGHDKNSADKVDSCGWDFEDPSPHFFDSPIDQREYCEWRRGRDPQVSRRHLRYLTMPWKRQA